jgi:DNA repair and recombination RAD54-like protein
MATAVTPKSSSVVVTTTPLCRPQKRAPASAEQLFKPFKCPGLAVRSVASTKPARKRRKVDYSGADGGKDKDDDDDESRPALAVRHANRYPVFEVRDKDVAFKRRFAVPLLNKDSAAYNALRAAPALGMRRGAAFIAKPLHDPSGEFAIVLYDPTVDDKPPEKILEAAAEPDCKPPDEEKKPKLDVPLMHKSLADILGLKKQVEERPRVPVVIDPRLAKVLRPHQVEGVKVRDTSLSSPNLFCNLCLDR